MFILRLRFKCGLLALVALQYRGVDPRVTRTRPSFPYEEGVKGVKVGSLRQFLAPLAPRVQEELRNDLQSRKITRRTTTRSIVMDDSNQPTLLDLAIIVEMGPTPLRTHVHPMGGHPSDSSSDDHMPSSMLRLTYSNPQAAGALVVPTYRPLTTQQTTDYERAADGGRLRQVNLGPGGPQPKPNDGCRRVDGD